MAIDAKTIAGLLAGQPPCSVCGLAATRGIPGEAATIEGESTETLFCDDCAPAGAGDRPNAVSIRMAKAYLLEAQRSPPGPAAPPAPVPPAVDDPRVRLGHDVRRIARAALGISAHVTTALPLAFATRISLLGQRAEARLVVPALARAVRLAARFDRGPVPRAATHEELVRVLAPRGGPGTPS